MTEGVGKTRPLIYEERRIQRRKNRLILSTITILIIVFFGGSLAWKTLTDSFIHIEFLKTGNLDRIIEVEGLVIRDEKVIDIPVNGEIKEIANEGEKVRINSHVADIMVSTVESSAGLVAKKVYAPIPGLISYNVDGLEEILNSKNIDELDLDKIDKLEESKEEKGINKASTDKQGVKIINNLGYTDILIRLNKEDLQGDNLKSRKTFKIQRLGSNNKIEYFTLKVKKVKEIDQQWLVLLETAYYQNIFNKRKVVLTLVLDNYKDKGFKDNGFKVPKEALVFKNSQPGLYMVKKSLVTWVPVTIIGEIDDMAVIDNVGDKTFLKLNIQYVTNPNLTSEGSTID